MQRSCLPEANGLNALDAVFCFLMKVLERSWLPLFGGWLWCFLLLLLLSGFLKMHFSQLIILHSANS